MSDVRKLTNLDRDKRALRSIRLPLGEPARADVTIGGDSFSWMAGSAVCCSHCRKVVGLLGRGLEPRLLDPASGWVLERRRKVQPGLVICGEGGCDIGPHYENPLACSDECENAILRDWRTWEHCAPPPGYQRGGPHV